MLVILTPAAATGLIGWFVGHEMGTASSEAQGIAETGHEHGTKRPRP